MAEIARRRTALVFCNTRGLAELIFQELWSANDDNLPIGIHHGSLSREARRKVENAMAEGGCVLWSQPPVWIWAWIGAMSIA